MTWIKPPRPSSSTWWRARALVSASLRADADGEFSMKEAVLFATVPGYPPELRDAMDYTDADLEKKLAEVVAQRLALVEQVLDPLAGYGDDIQLGRTSGHGHKPLGSVP